MNRQRSSSTPPKTDASRVIPAVLGNYKILGKLGHGGMGLVLKARHTRMQREVAIKILSPRVTKSPEALRRFEREVHAAAKLEHPNIVIAYDADEADDTHFLVMQYVEGVNLAELVKRRGPLEIDQAVSCVLQAARGLEYAHQRGIVHRDIKPSNILLSTDGQIKVLDMGLARIEASDTGQEELTGSGQIMGTVDFMSPEQAISAKNADSRSDIYSLGITLWYLLSGRVTFEGESVVERLMAHQTRPTPALSEIRPRATSHLQSVFAKMIAKDPNDRYQTMSELIADLHAYESEARGRSTSFASTTSGESSGDDLLRALVCPAEAPSTKKDDDPGPWELADTIDMSEDAEAETRTWQATPNQSNSNRRTRAAIAIGVIALVALLAGVFLKIKTPIGTIVLEIDQPDAIGAKVSVDGTEKITISSTGEETIEIEADDKRHKLRVTKGGFETFVTEFTAGSGENKPIRVRLEPVPQTAMTTPVKASGTPSLAFDGESSFVDIPSFNYDGSYPITVEVDLEPSSGENFHVFSDFQAGGLALLYQDHQWRLVVGSSEGEHTMATFESDVEVPARTVLAGVRDGDTVRLFIDGVLVREVKAESEFRRSPFHFVLGANPQGDVEDPDNDSTWGELFIQRFRGQLHAVRVSKIARYSENYDPSSSFEPDDDAFILYDFRAGQGRVLEDRSGNGHAGKIIGATWVTPAASN